jgi:hypothetical protein
MEAHLIVRRSEDREAAAYFRGRQLLILETVLHRALPGPGHQRAVPRAHHEAAGGHQETPPAVPLESGPLVVGPLHKGDVLRMLEVGLANDAALPVRGAQRVGRAKPIEADDALAPAGQLQRRHAAHGAESNDAHVVCGHGVIILWAWPTAAQPTA